MTTLMMRASASTSKNKLASGIAGVGNLKELIIIKRKNKLNKIIIINK